MEQNLIVSRWGIEQTRGKRIEVLLKYRELDRISKAPLIGLRSGEKRIHLSEISVSLAKRNNDYEGKLKDYIDRLPEDEFTMDELIDPLVFIEKLEERVRDLHKAVIFLFQGGVSNPFIGVYLSLLTDINRIEISQMLCTGLWYQTGIQA